MFVEDPLFISEICQTLVSQIDQAASRKSQKEKLITMSITVGKLLEVSISLADFGLVVHRIYITQVSRGGEYLKKSHFWANIF